MEELLKALILAVVQGITEWLPVSSSGHLFIVGELIGFPGGLVFDIALHFGTLMAVFVYFGRDIINIIEDFLRGRRESESFNMGVMLIIASVPAGISGFFLRGFYDGLFSNLEIVAMGFCITGVLLFISSIDFGKREDKIDYKVAFLIGLAQVFSIIPGISRSGSTLSAGLILGLSEEKAVKFSFLMAVPVIFGANVFILGSEGLPSNLIWASLVSFITGLIAIHLLYTNLLRNRKNLFWFGAYALILGIIILLWRFFG